MFRDREDINSINEQNPNRSKPLSLCPLFLRNPAQTTSHRAGEAVELWSWWDQAGLGGAGGPQHPPGTPRPNLRVDATRTVVKGEHPSPLRYTVGCAGSQQGGTSLCINGWQSNKFGESRRGSGRGQGLNVSGHLFTVANASGSS